MNRTHEQRLHAQRRIWLVIGLIALALLGLSAWAVEQAIASGSAAPTKQASPIHPTFPLLDANEENVLVSGQALSLNKTCGACHDTEFIESHAFHADLGLSELTEAGQATSGTPWDTSNGLFGEFDPLTYRYLTQAGDERLDLSTAEWLKVNGARVAGGGPATTSRAGEPLLTSTFSGPETSILDPATGQASPWDWTQSGVMEMNCLLCHTTEPNRKKLNPLQQISHFGLLNVLLPFQIITGALMWGVQQWPQIATMMGGLPYLAPFHTLIAWLLATFVVAHVYLTTTGATVGQDINAMVTGWENVPVHDGAIVQPGE